MVVVVAVRARAQWVPSSIAMDPGAASWFCEQQTVQGGASPPATAELQWPLRCKGCSLRFIWGQIEFKGVGVPEGETEVLVGRASRGVARPFRYSEHGSGGMARLWGVSPLRNVLTAGSRRLSRRAGAPNALAASTCLSNHSGQNVSAMDAATARSPVCAIFSPEPQPVAAHSSRHLMTTNFLHHSSKAQPTGAARLAAFHIVALPLFIGPQLHEHICYMRASGRARRRLRRVSM